MNTLLTAAVRPAHPLRPFRHPASRISSVPLVPGRVFAVQDLLAANYAIAPGDRTTREPGEPGVRLRCFLDLRQEPGS
ncbi:DUF6207 family protein [Streptomyces canus]|uniref:DUF6207 family protein n=1 Tax=Streptomyces canus TaxID=58343 RepID=UPI002E321C35|nr:DUF6207 family protein [Streptomyces canus]